MSTMDGEKKVLIVEDNAAGMLLTHAFVTRIIPNSLISKAYSGKEAMELLDRETYDLIILDLLLPDIHGLEIADNIRTNRNHPNHKTPIIALTADVMPTVHEQCLKAGINDFIKKPAKENDLRQSIVKILNKS